MCGFAKDGPLHMHDGACSGWGSYWHFQLSCTVYSFTCCHTGTYAVDQHCHLNHSQSRFTDTWPTILSNDPLMPGFRLMISSSHSSDGNSSLLNEKVNDRICQSTLGLPPLEPDIWLASEAREISLTQSDVSRKHCTSQQIECHLQIHRSVYLIMS